MNAVVVIKNVLSDREIEALTRDCSHASRNFTSQQQFVDTSCAVDLFENSSFRDENIRLDPQSYFTERWRGVMESDCEISPQDKQLIITALTTTLPRALNRILHKRDIYLFNEHYVVKPASSDIVFKWHRDADKQLQFCFSQDVEYQSMWCALDDVSDENGTLQVPHGTAVQTLDLADDTHRGEYLCSHSPSDNGCESSAMGLCIDRGSAVVFSSLLWHCSGPNSSQLSRRVLYAQYSSSVITATGTRSSASCGDDSGGALIAEEGNRKRRRKEAASPLCFAIPCNVTSSELECGVIKV